MEKVIAGIQQIGIGIPDVHKATEWYRKYFGMDIKVFEDAATAELMLPYTGGKPHDRTAILTLNMKGGGGFEIWQYTSRKPQPAEFDIKMGDLGINCGKIKSINVPQTFEEMTAAGLDVITPLKKTPADEFTFFVKDLYGNIWQIVESTSFYKKKTPSSTGGVVGAVIGSSDIDKSLKLYRDVLGYDVVVFDETGSFSDFGGLPNGDDQYRRVLLRHSEVRKGGFSKMFGPTEIELIEVKVREGRKIYEDRYWGDLGFIHLCFDIQGMDYLQEDLEEEGFPFTVDSANSFDMGEAAGRFTYVEDPDGTLIEFVETHRVPILKKLGWYIDMTKRDPKKNLPDWMIGALKFNKLNDPESSSRLSGAAKTGWLFLAAWVVFQIVLFNSGLENSSVQVSSWATWSFLTLASFFIPFLLVKGGGSIKRLVQNKA
ncbi:VOC family protein [Gracilimonas sp.]|uniref:VOC family protein n=1 Tax=Gracilimonas sp. TaxID=1974203 RepID=UPI002871FEE5|nr:VOC family protein [Gracilimonas sp.]